MATKATRPDATGHWPQRAAAVLVVLAVTAAGVALRAGVWMRSTDTRWPWDAMNATRIGNMTLDEGVWNAYDLALDKAPADGRLRLDYAPGRLLAVTAWMRWNRRANGLGEIWMNSGQYHLPLLGLNVLSQLIAAAAVWRLMTPVPNSGPPAGEESSGHGWFRGTCGRRLLFVPDRALPGLAALGLWLHPALLLNGFVWPQWDSWALPFYLIPLLLVLRRQALAAGLVFGVGCLFKGQILFALPFLLGLLGSLAGVRACLRYVVAMGAGLGAVALPFMVRSPLAPVWIASATLVPWAVPWILSALGRNRGGWVPASTAAALLLWALPLAPTGSGRIAVLAVAGLAAAFVALPGRPRASTAAVALAQAALVATIWAFGSSWTWFEVSYLHPTQRYPSMVVGPAANLPALLDHLAGVSLDTRVASSGPLAGLKVTLVLKILFLLLAVWASAWAARSFRRGSPRRFAAFVVPWIVMFCLLPQMHERYLVWGAALSVMLLPLGILGLILCGLTSALASQMMLQALLEATPWYAPNLLATFQAAYLPAAVVTVAATVGVLALAWEPATKRPAEPIAPPGRA